MVTAPGDGFGTKTVTMWPLASFAEEHAVHEAGRGACRQLITQDALNVTSALMPIASRISCSRDIATV
jgi:hypothetical protein